MSDRSQLLGMGFEEARVDWALRATSNSGLQPALDHLLNNMDNPIPAANASSAPSGSANVGGNDDDDDDKEALAAHITKMGGKPGDANVAEAKSVKCSECGKIFKNSSLVSFHAEKSGHSNFEESTEEIIPLTEEQKAAKLQELKQRLAEKRAKQALDDEKAVRENNALRRKAGRDTEDAKEAMKKKEAERAVAQAKKDKIEDAKAKAAIKAQIEADKKERAEKAAREKALRAGEAPPVAASQSGPGLGSAVKAAAAASAGKGSDNPETRLQIRLATGGAPLVKAFPSDSPLSIVAEFIASENLQYNADTVKLSTTFPRKTFSAAEMKKSLKENGLTPSAVLMAN